MKSYLFLLRSMSSFRSQKVSGSEDWMLGLDHGAGHPSRRRSSVEAPKCLKDWEFGDPFRHAWWPKVAGAVIEAGFSGKIISH
jgi:hypothetical protein